MFHHGKCPTLWSVFLCQKPWEGGEREEKGRETREENGREVGKRKEKRDGRALQKKAMEGEIYEWKKKMSDRVREGGRGRKKQKEGKRDLLLVVRNRFPQVPSILTNTNTRAPTHPPTHTAQHYSPQAHTHAVTWTNNETSVCYCNPTVYAIHHVKRKQLNYLEPRLVVV